ncbi:ubiquinone biosynthesis accessory factor UbiJ [Chitinibacteraceae bacterium HSL-7]
MLAASLNLLLADQPDVRAALAAYAGRTVRIVAPVLSATVVVTQDGAMAESAAEPEATLTIPWRFVMLHRIDRATALRTIGLAGNEELAAGVGRLLGELEFDRGEWLSRWMGDAPAHRVDRALTVLTSAPLRAGERMARHLTEYWRDETGAIVSRPLLEQRFSDIDTLRDDVARLQARVAQMEKRLNACD